MQSRDPRRDPHFDHQEKLIDKFLITDEQAYIALALTYGKLRTRSCYFNPVGGFNKNNSLVELLDTSVLEDLASEQAELEEDSEDVYGLRDERSYKSTNDFEGKYV